MTDLRLFNSLTREIETFNPVRDGEARVYTCGPTVYNYPHIGNMRAYVFADVLGRTLSYKGYKLTHVINITDVGHLTDDADAGEDKLEKAAAENAQSIWDIARHYTEAYWADIKALNIREPAKWSIATDYVPQMIEFAKGIAAEHCYELNSGLYFDVSTVADYGRLAGHNAELLREAHQLSRRLKNIPTDLNSPSELKAYIYSEVGTFLRIVERLREGSPAKKLHSEIIAIFDAMPPPTAEDFLDQLNERVGAFGVFLKRTTTEGRIEEIKGKRNPEDFAIWRKTPPGETRQMEWDSPWGRGAPGWHLECSVMSGDLLGFPFDIHTGGIDHREIHHPNEIAQNQAHCCTNGLDVAANSGANIWMHNNFLVERSGKMSKSSGEFLRLQLLIDRGYHPLAYRMMCLQAHYRSELEFSWEGLGAALVRLKRLVMGVERLKAEAAGGPTHAPVVAFFDDAISDDLNTSVVLTALEAIFVMKKASAENKLVTITEVDSVLGLSLLKLTRADLRIRPKAATISEEHIEASLAMRKEARAAQNYAMSDRLRDELAAKGVEVMDGDPLGWDWKLV